MKSIHRNLLIALVAISGLGLLLGLLWPYLFVPQYKAVDPAVEELEMPVEVDIDRNRITMHNYEKIAALTVSGNNLAYLVNSSEKQSLDLYLSEIEDISNKAGEPRRIGSIPAEGIVQDEIALQFDEQGDEIWLSAGREEREPLLKSFDLLGDYMERLFPYMEGMEFSSISLSKDSYFFAQSKIENAYYSFVKVNGTRGAPKEFYEFTNNQQFDKNVGRISWVEITGDKSRAAFILQQGDDAGYGQLWLHDFTGNDTQLISENAGKPSWCPGDRFMVFWEQEEPGIVIYNALTGIKDKVPASELVGDQGRSSALTWDEQGNNILYVSRHDSREYIHYIDVQDYLTAGNLQEEYEEYNDQEAAAQEETYDIAILNGTVIDPDEETIKFGYNLGINGKEIAVITKSLISGEEVIDATGMVISPGFIDILSYSPNQVGNRFKVADGVTTNLAMHGAAVDFKEWFAQYERQRMILNYGGAVLHGRSRYMLGLGINFSPSARQIARMKELTEQAILDGAIGLSFSPEYYPGMTEEEIKAVMEVGRKYDMVSFFHVRYSTMYGPGGDNIDALEEVISYARELDAPVQVVHINSTGGTFSMEESLSLIEEARAEGLDITIDLYPYDYWATYANSARFAPGWKTRFQISYSDLQVANSTERLTEESFNRYRKTNTVLIAHAIPEEEVKLAMLADYAMIGSDTIVQPSLNNHPRGSGCFSRTIGLYAREKRTISLMKALRMMTILPANRLENVAPALQKKGRLQEGMDADITIFDYEKIIDTAKPENVASYSEGVEYVVVNGTIVRDPQGFRDNVSPGEPIRSYFE